MKPCLFLDRRLDTAPLDEFGRGNQREDLDAAAGLHGPPRGEAQGNFRFRALVDHDQIDAHPALPSGDRWRWMKPDARAWS
jgi:hypothetical protein